MSDTVLNQWEEVLEAEDTEYVTVPIGKSGKSARLGSLNGEDLLTWFANQRDPEQKKTNGLWLVAKCLVNDTGQRIGNMDDVLRLREKAPATIKALVEAAVTLNKLDVKAPNAPSETSTGDSPIDSLSPLGE
jgi:hypothetical protein